jgi:hypothetical protein
VKIRTAQAEGTQKLNLKIRLIFSARRAEGIPKDFRQRQR